MKPTAAYKQVGELWAAWVEEIPEVSTQGKTLEEARENLKDALQMVLEANRELAEKTRTNAARRIRACLKRAQLGKHLRSHGCKLYREGGRHSVWWNPANRKRSAVPGIGRKNQTARSICRSPEVPEP